MTGIDASDVSQLVLEMDAAAIEALPDARGVIQKGALNIKKGAQSRVSGLPHAPGAPGAITYETKIAPGYVEAEIGYDKGHYQGALGNLLEYGSIKNAPIPALGPELQAEAEATVKALADAVAKTLDRLL